MRYFGLNHRPSSGVKLKLKELRSLKKIILKFQFTINLKYMINIYKFTKLILFEELFCKANIKLKLLILIKQN